MKAIEECGMAAWVYHKRNSYNHPWWGELVLPYLYLAKYMDGWWGGVSNFELTPEIQEKSLCLYIYSPFSIVFKNFHPI